jgi:hypothetical protein
MANGAQTWALRKTGTGMNDSARERQKRFREKNARTGMRELRLWVPDDRVEEIRGAVAKLLGAVHGDENPTQHEQAGKLLLKELLAEPTRAEKIMWRGWIAVRDGEGDPEEIPMSIVVSVLAQERMKKCAALGIPAPSWALRLGDQ